MPGEISSRNGIRAADTDRDGVAEQLSTALAEGRLALDEYDLRLSAAMRARTLGELEPLTADLPAAAAAAPAETAPAETGERESGWREWLDQWRWWLGGAIIMTGIWATTGAVDGDWGYFWPAIPLGIWAAVLIASLVWPDDESE